MNEKLDEPIKEAKSSMTNTIGALIIGLGFRATYTILGVPNHKYKITHY